jgi:hypothetical protein
MDFFFFGGEDCVGEERERICMFGSKVYHVGINHLYDSLINYKNGMLLLYFETLKNHRTNVQAQQFKATIKNPGSLYQVKHESSS